MVGLMLQSHQAGDIDRLLHGQHPATTAPQQQTRAVSHFQPPENAEHKPCNLYV